MKLNYKLLSEAWEAGFSIIAVVVVVIIVIAIVVDRNRKRKVTNGQSGAVEQESPKRRHSLSTFFIKLFILIGIVVFALWNYRLFEINKGWSNSNVNDNKISLSQAVEIIVDIEKIEYYEYPHSCNSENYNVHISTSTKSYLFSATANEIMALNAFGNFSSRVKPKSVFVVPYYFEIIAGLIVIFIPIGRKR